MAERTGCPILFSLWSYVLDHNEYGFIFDMKCVLPYNKKYEGPSELLSLHIVAPLKLTQKPYSVVEKQLEKILVILIQSGYGPGQCNNLSIHYGEQQRSVLYLSEQNFISPLHNNFKAPKGKRKAVMYAA